MKGTEDQDRSGLWLSGVEPLASSSKALVPYNYTVLSGKMFFICHFILVYCIFSLCSAVLHE